jgi:hypothetical protein
VRLGVCVCVEGSLTCTSSHIAGAHSIYFKTYIAEFIAKSTEGKGQDDPMVQVREQLLREIGKKEVEVAAKDEQCVECECECDPSPPPETRIFFSPSSFLTDVC